MMKAWMMRHVKINYFYICAVSMHFKKMHILLPSSSSMLISMNGVWRQFIDYGSWNVFTAEQSDDAENDALTVLKNTHVCVHILVCYHFNKTCYEVWSEFIPRYYGVQTYSYYTKKKRLLLQRANTQHSLGRETGPACRCESSASQQSLGELIVPGVTGLGVENHRVAFEGVGGPGVGVLLDTEMSSLLSIAADLRWSTETVSSRPLSSILKVLSPRKSTWQGPSYGG